MLAGGGLLDGEVVEVGVVLRAFCLAPFALRAFIIPCIQDILQGGGVVMERRSHVLLEEVVEAAQGHRLEGAGLGRVQLRDRLQRLQRLLLANVPIFLDLNFLSVLLMEEASVDVAVDVAVDVQVLLLPSEVESTDAHA
eukprot:CAMPEP_0170547910 /NCGR_PEP_ID=MMETSP0211-20121228/6223_1 /TAXON_ID=311385 /ORGANISM="Pseudokeronopsis sp., Strain OXSARD2" /LENGTH=138 /DNA_ID=CAMNT_0010853135 /DNA_START=206 /DNA_END=623 /DNA_ORIENTATION=+